MIDEPPADFTDTSESMGFGEKIAKSFIHGLLYSIIMLFIAEIWINLTLLLAGLASIIGLIAGLVFLFLSMGAINKSLVGVLWKIHCKGTWQSLTGHGIALFVILLVIQIPVMFIEWFLMIPYTLEYQVVSFILFAFVYGIVGKALAKTFVQTETYVPWKQTPRTTSTRPIRGICPSCTTSYWYAQVSIYPDGSVACRNCSTNFVIRSPDTQPFEGDDDWGALR